MMKINWRVRIKNPVWWVQILVALAMPVLAYKGLSAQDFTSWGMLWNTVLEAAKNPYVIGCALVGVWNAVYDPAAKSLAIRQSDSSQTESQEQNTKE